MIRDPIPAITIISPVKIDGIPGSGITGAGIGIGIGIGSRDRDREPVILASSLKGAGSGAGTTAEERDFSRRAPAAGRGGGDAFYTGRSEMPCFRAVEGISKNLHVKVFEMPCSRVTEMPCGYEPGRHLGKPDEVLRNATTS